MISSPKITAALALTLALGLTIFPVGQAAAEEEPLAPEFLEYLGTVEASGLKGMEKMSMEEIYLMLKKVLQGDGSAKKKDDPAQTKEKEHGDNRKK